MTQLSQFKKLCLSDLLDLKTGWTGNLTRQKQNKSRGKNDWHLNIQNGDDRRYKIKPIKRGIMDIFICTEHLLFSIHTHTHTHTHTHIYIYICICTCRCIMGSISTFEFSKQTKDMRQVFYEKPVLQLFCTDRQHTFGVWCDFTRNLCSCVLVSQKNWDEDETWWDPTKIWWVNNSLISEAA